MWSCCFSIRGRWPSEARGGDGAAEYAAGRREYHRGNGSRLGPASGARIVAAGIPAEFRGLVFWEIMVFIVILSAAFAYAWRKGVFEWR